MNPKPSVFPHLIISWIIFLCLVDSCSLVPASIPVNSEKDIVFVFLNRDPSKNGGILLMNADGTGVETVREGNKHMMPVWSPDKEKILVVAPIFRERLGSLYGFLSVYGGQTNCGRQFFYGRQRWVTNQEIITVRTDEEGGIPFHPKILIWDIAKCSVSREIYEEETHNGFSDPDYSNTGNVVFTRNVDGIDWVTIFHPKNEKATTIEKGFGATWSPDGMNVVFTGAEGLYISDGEGRSIRKAVDLTGEYPVENGKIAWDEWPPMAVWSPDGRYLLYHRKNGYTYDLVKFEIAAGLETVIYTGGMYPDWR